MRRIFLASSVVWAAGCAATVRSAPPPSENTALVEARERRVSELEADAAARVERIRQLEAQLALSRAEVDELRDAPAPIVETVRIGEERTPATPADGWVAEDGIAVTDGGLDAVVVESEPEAERGGPRPLLRLYGSPAASLESSAVTTSDPRAAALPLPVPSGASAPAPIPASAFAPAPLPALHSLAAASPASAPAVPPTPPRAAPVDADAVARYRAALEHMREGRLPEAATALAGFLAAYPRHAYADNALYWRGEVLYAMRRYPEALQNFERVVREHPRGNKVADALLKIGLCHRRMGDQVRARAYFRRVRDEHPGSVAARLASQEDAS